LFNSNKSQIDNDELQLLDELDSVWVNFWNAEAQEKLLKIGELL
jgi:hypothetical protein